MLFRDQLVLTKSGWATKSTEFVFDVFLCLVMGALFWGAAISALVPHSLVFMALLVPALGYYFVLKHLSRYSYTMGSIMQIFYVLIVLPYAWMDPMFVAVSASLAFILLAYGKRFLQLPFFFYFFSIHSVWMVALGLETNNELPGFWHSQWVVQPLPSQGVLGEGRLGILDSWGVGIWALAAFAVFRRPSVFLMGIWFLAIAVVFRLDLGWENAVMDGLVFGTVLFLGFLLPGRNHYAGVWISQLTALAVFVVVYLFRIVLVVDFPFFLVAVGFFLLEAIVFKITLVYKPRIESVA